MSTVRAWVGAISAVWCVSVVPAQGQADGARPPWWREAPEGRSAALWGLMNEHLDAMIRRWPAVGVSLGDERFNDRLPDESPAAYADWVAQCAARLDRLRVMDRAGFAEEDRVDADLLLWGLERTIEGAKFHAEQMPVAAIDGPQVSLPQLPDNSPMLTEKHRTDYVAKLEQVPRVIDQMIDQMRRGVAAGRVQPRVAVEPAVGVTKSLAEASDDASTSPFFRPFAGRAEDAVSARARAVITGGITPAYGRLLVFLRDEYLAACRASIAAGEGVDGLAVYNFAVAGHTTTDLTADQIHEIGLSEVARIRTEMFRTIARTDFPRKNELQGDELFRAFVAYLRTDPRFYFKSSDQLMAHYRDVCKRIDAELPRLFGVLPRNPYGVAEIPRFAAPSQTTAYYQPGSLKAGIPGYYMANTYALDQRPRYEVIALSMHEAVPGHHLQIALAQELEGVHPLRTQAGYTAFSEGWALYSERLGLEMGDTSAGGLYSDPYDDFGRLTYEMWRACRLVVDPGMHAKGWTRQRAIEFMLANSALSKHNIEREVDRYIGWPGQACGYKIGELKIRELRARAESRLGPRFDLRSFHDAVLGAGAVPLPVLEARIERWISGSG